MAAPSLPPAARRPPTAADRLPRTQEPYGAATGGRLRHADPAAARANGPRERAA
ncbi:hypothetical protein [Kitasatospora nipponensis]|uniref:hypothetical protein n=1 Tax=Kitasatospora nipponensis TaxID=258049 RepID=UPI0031CF5CCF